MAITTSAPVGCDGDVLAKLRAARREMDTWIAHAEAYLVDGAPGQAHAAARSAAIVAASVTEAAADTRAAARLAAELAFLNAA